jgi:hypothetical protein
MKFKEIFALLLIPTIVFGGGSFVVPVANQTTVTNSFTSGIVEGYIDAIYIDVTGTTSSRVWVASADEQVYSNAVIKVDTAIRPTKPRHDSTGTQLVGVSSLWSRIYIDNQRLTFYVAELSANTNTYLFKVKMVKQLP